MKKCYYAIIPANVRYDKDLTAGAKLLYGEITTLCNEIEPCTETNRYFAEVFGVSKETISRRIAQLASSGYITMELVYEDGTKEIKQRNVWISQNVGGADYDDRQNY